MKRIDFIAVYWAVEERGRGRGRRWFGRSAATLEGLQHHYLQLAKHPIYYMLHAAPYSVDSTLSFTRPASALWRGRLVAFEVVREGASWPDGRVASSVVGTVAIRATRFKHLSRFSRRPQRSAFATRQLVSSSSKASFSHPHTLSSAPISLLSLFHHFRHATNVEGGTVASRACEGWPSMSVVGG